MRWRWRSRRADSIRRRCCRKKKRVQLRVQFVLLLIKNRLNLLLQPGPKLSRANEARSKAEDRDGGGREDGDPRDLIPIQRSKNRRRVSVDCQSVEQPRARKQGMVSRRKYAGHDDSVDEAAGCCGTRHLEDQCEWRSPGVLVVQSGGGVGNVET